MEDEVTDGVKQHAGCKHGRQETETMTGGLVRVRAHDESEGRRKRERRDVVANSSPFKSTSAT